MFGAQLQFEYRALRTYLWHGDMALTPMQICVNSFFFWLLFSYVSSVSSNHWKIEKVSGLAQLFDLLNFLAYVAHGHRPPVEKRKHLAADNVGVLSLWEFAMAACTSICIHCLPGHLFPGIPLKKRKEKKKKSDAIHFNDFPTVARQCF